MLLKMGVSRLNLILRLGIGEPWYILTEIGLPQNGLLHMGGEDFDYQLREDVFTQIGSLCVKSNEETANHLVIHQ